MFVYILIDICFHHVYTLQFNVYVCLCVSMHMCMLAVFINKLFNTYLGIHTVITCQRHHFSPSTWKG